MGQLSTTEMTKLVRAKERGSFEASDIHKILDATPICHFGYTVDGRPVVTPTCHWREGDYVYWHGSRISRALIESEASDVCLTVTHLDGMVLARSAFHHSANYRSVMVFGKPELIDDDEHKLHTLEVFIEHLFPGRWATLREVTDKELNATTVLRLPITEASAKVRTGPPIDLAEDLDFPVWAGVVPIDVTTGTPEPAPDMRMELPVPDHASSYTIG